MTLGLIQVIQLIDDSSIHSFIHSSGFATAADTVVVWVTALFTGVVGC
jgi:hypothetical protein